MSLRNGAETICDQCLKIENDEHVLVVNDGNDQDLIDILLEVAEDEAGSVEYMEYEEPENHGDEPPQRVSGAMSKADVVIAPTKKSLTHTDARRDACDAGARVATLPGITKEIWNSSLQADYSEVERISEKVYSMLEETDEVRIKTPSGTDLRFEIDIDLYHTDTGMIDETGNFGNLPAGEADGGVINAEGILVADHFPFAPEGTRVEIEDSEAIAIEHPENKSSDLSEAFSTIEGSRNVAEFGFGTNPEATLIGNVLQDEKVLGTVHIAFGDNSSYMPDGHERKVNCEIHWDTVCESPTVWFDDRKVLDNGEPTFL